MKKKKIIDQVEDPAAPQGEDLDSPWPGQSCEIPPARSKAGICQSKGCDQPSVFYHRPSHKRYCRRHYIQIVNAKARG